MSILLTSLLGPSIFWVSVLLTVLRHMALGTGAWNWLMAELWITIGHHMTSNLPLRHLVTIIRG